MTNAKQKANKVDIHEIEAIIYLKKSKFDKMTEEQKDKAIKLLTDFKRFLN